MTSKIPGIRLAGLLILGLSAIVSLQSVMAKPSVSPQVLDNGPALPRVNLAALRGNGKVAFAWQGKLFVADGRTDALYRISDSAHAALPAWSSDGRWVAYVRPSNLGYPLQGEVWIARANGTGAHQLSGLPGPVSTFQWSPRGDVLAAIAEVSRRQTGIFIAGVTGPARKLAGNIAGISSMAWSRDGHSLAVDGIPAGSVNQSDRLLEVDARSGAVRTRYISLPSHDHSNSMIVAGWWPNSRGILFWRDPYASASVAANGLPLFSIPIRGGKPRFLLNSLPYPDWLTAPGSGPRIGVIAGRWRPVYFGKYLAICVVSLPSCQRVVLNARLGPSDPSWSPDGKYVALALARDLPGNWSFSSVSAYAKWDQTRKLWIYNVRTRKAHMVVRAGSTISAPAWSRDSKELMFVREDGLWIMRARAGTPTRIVQLLPSGSPIPGETASALSYYGHMDWKALFAWSGA